MSTNRQEHICSNWRTNEVYVKHPMNYTILYSKTMINNINHFGTINFYENNHSDHSRTESSKQVEDIEPLSVQKNETF